jgi:O-acetyl-ADP-ribose deacetylase (regulator of RNase III)
MRILIDGIAVECSIGNITAQQDISAIVNPAGPGLAPGPGVTGAIHAKAGSGLYQECMVYAPLMTGKAIITGGHLLPNKHVIHCLPPAKKSPQAVRQLEQCYINSLLLADEHQLHSVAFPSLISGSLGNPPISTAAIALGAIRTTAPLLRFVRRIRFVLFDRQIFLQYRNLLAANPESVMQNRITG